MDYVRAIEFIKQRRANDLLAGESLYFSSLKEYPELAKADSEYRAATLEGLKSGDTSLADGKLNERNEIIKKLGLWDKFYPAPHCDKCNDVGYVGKRVCDCVKAMCVGDDLVAFPLHSFDEVDEKLFEGRDATAFFNARDTLVIAFEKKFPNTKKRIFSLIGKSGTGKTFLASACANAAISKGGSVVFLTAFGVIARATKYHTTFDESKESWLQPLFDCDLLIIDDLGTEAIYKNVTLEYLYLLINERQLKGKHTMITSNLSLDQIVNRYGERIASRILDNKTCFVAEFEFEDIRKIKI